MKKFLLCSAATLISSVAFASSTPQYIITDCGTVYQIPDNTSIDDAIDAIDAHSNADCGTHYE